MKTIYFAIFFSALAASAYAEPISQPTFMTNDTWSYRLTILSGGTLKESHTTFTVTRVGSDGILVTETTDANPGHVRSTMFGRDWSKRRSINGKETTVLQPLSFPLNVGKAWQVEYTELNPNPQKLRETDVYPFKAVGWEDIAVPAGKFHALKIESEGRWTADVTPRVLNNAVVARHGTIAAQTTEQRVVQGVRVSGRFYKCFWYVPEVKRWVKSIEENYNSGGDLNQSFSDELESYNVDGVKNSEAPPAKPVEPSAAPAKKDAI
jgi:hypothetical protein